MQSIKPFVTNIVVRIEYLSGSAGAKNGWLEVALIEKVLSERNCFMVNRWWVEDLGRVVNEVSRCY